jgi:rhombotail lipoprotein
MYGVDVMALMSYDQVQFTDQNILALTYWTIVGAYVVNGERNETRTMLDAAVYDIASRKLLFRAPGYSQVKRGATLVNLSKELRGDSERGFKEAATNLVSNLIVQLEDFRQRVTNSPTEYKIVRKPGYIGAGALGGLETGCIGLIGMSFFWIHFRRRQR